MCNSTIGFCSINITRMGQNWQRSLLPHIFAVFGVVCGGNTKREFYLQTCVLIFSKIALKKDIRAQNDLCVGQLETSTSPTPGQSPGIWAFEDWIVGVFKCHTQSSNLSVRGCRRLLPSFIRVMYKNGNTCLITLYMIMPSYKSKTLVLKLWKIT